jgi:hypothetical protein
LPIGYRSGKHFTVHAIPQLFGRKRYVMRKPRNYPQSRPFALEIIAPDFAFAAGHRRIAINFVAGSCRALQWGDAGDPSAHREPDRMPDAGRKAYGCRLSLGQLTSRSDQIISACRGAPEFQPHLVTAPVRTGRDHLVQGGFNSANSMMTVGVFQSDACVIS